MTIDPRRLDFLRRRLEGALEQRAAIQIAVAHDPRQAAALKAIEEKIAAWERELSEGTK
jgi:hypothetical protein